MANKNVNILLTLQDKMTGPMKNVGKEVETQRKAMHKLNSSVYSFSRNVRDSFLHGAAQVAKFGLAAGAAAAGIATVITKQVVDNYAEYEQLTGGIQTLFEDLSWDVQQNAANAFKTAGLSANEYMDTAMSFAASLNASLVRTEGNIARSADLTDMAIVDMADNANKMGSSMESIQLAYQGFAKQNYTMLDNLKLGYGGTKTEMERLLADAQKLTGVKYHIENFSDVVEAIHAVQQEMGITGTTAKEAAATISGSIGMTKAAWANLLTGMGDPEADIEQLVDNVVESAGTVVERIAPVAEQALKSILRVIKAAAPKIRAKISELMDELLPPQVREAVDKVKTGIERAWSIIQPILSMAVKHADTLIPAILGVVGAISAASVVADVATKVHSGVKAFNDLRTAVKDAGGVLSWLKTGPIGLIIIGIAAAVAAVVYLWNHCEGFRNFVKKAASVIVNAWNNIKTTAVLVKDVAVVAFNALKDKIVGAFNTVKEKVAPVIQWIKDRVDDIKKLIDSIKQFGRDVTSGPWVTNNGGGSGSELHGHATGTPYWRGGLTRINEGGRGELVDLPSGTRIIPHDVSKQVVSGGNTFNMTFNLNGLMIGTREFMEQTGEYITREIMNAWEVTP